MSTRSFPVAIVLEIRFAVAGIAREPFIAMRALWREVYQPIIIWRFIDDGRRNIRFWFHPPTTFRA